MELTEEYYTGNGLYKLIKERGIPGWSVKYKLSYFLQENKQKYNIIIFREGQGKRFLIDRNNVEKILKDLSA